MMLVVKPDINFVDLQPAGPGMGVANDYPVIEFVLAKAKNIFVLRGHHRPNVFFFVVQIVITHKLLSTIQNGNHLLLV